MGPGEMPTEEQLAEIDQPIALDDDEEDDGFGAVLDELSNKQKEALSARWAWRFRGAGKAERAEMRTLRSGRETGIRFQLCWDGNGRDFFPERDAASAPFFPAHPGNRA